MLSQKPSARPYRLSLGEHRGVPHEDAEGITEELIHAVVNEFYRRVRLDSYIGPVFDEHIDDWPLHLSRMDDFWSAALLRTGRFSGNPVETHRGIPTLEMGHFDRWIVLFAATVHEMCQPREARAFLVRALRMREGLSKSLLPDPRNPYPTR